MNKTADYIKQRLSLRVPLKDSLDIMAQVTSLLKLTKDEDLSKALDKIKTLYPTCTDFEREFPSVCFSVATGVGKTRLMAAFIAYLVITKKSKNFFILAPNLTIYDKLIKDFGDSGYAKYVFRGLREFVHNKPQIITGENYSQQTTLFSKTSIQINIFNIAKFNSENRGTKKLGVSLPSRIRRLSEYLGQSYWKHLSGLDDLVILMDEAHRYHADASKAAINELKPILGLELTATPIDEKGNQFRNVVYEYSLARALADGKYIKNPTIATRNNYDPKKHNEEEKEKIKLVDAISCHKKTKVSLEVYARANDVRLVQPFVLVVCRDTTHAKSVYDFISSRDFYEGEFDKKVLQIDSKNKTEEIEKQFLTLEHPDNKIEIVIHVNMLKEGWDVTNLYTIVPLRAARAAVLIEQTIGRGLRLPYNGERTGDPDVDKLTVIAHDNFQQVLEEAQNPNSILNKLSFVTLDEADLGAVSEAVTAQAKQEVILKKEADRIKIITNQDVKRKAQTNYDAKRSIIDILPTLNTIAGVGCVDDLKQPAIKAQVLKIINQKLNQGQGQLFAGEMLAEAETIYESVVSGYKNNIIEIPRISVVPGETKAWFEDFNLDTTHKFDFKALDEMIKRVSLVDNEIDFIGVQHGAFFGDTPLNQLISKLLNYDDIDYDTNKALLVKLCTQALTALDRQTTKATDLKVVVEQYREAIAGRIYEQMQPYFRTSVPAAAELKVFPFVKIEDWNFSVLKVSGYRDFSKQINPVNLIPKFVYRGFEKACHFEYKFDSKAEKDFANICESDKMIEKWLRPARKQFKLYWGTGSSEYLPDFVVETKGNIYLVEVKSSAQLLAPEVVLKTKTATMYCASASEYTASNGGKPWSYLLIPHDEIKTNSSFEHLVNLNNV